MVARHKLQKMMRDHNPTWYDPKDLIKTEDMAPDSDAILTADVIKGQGRTYFVELALFR